MERQSQSNHATLAVANQLMLLYMATSPAGHLAAVMECLTSVSSHRSISGSAKFWPAAKNPRKKWGR